MDISPYLRRVARGKNGAENLSRREAADVLEHLMRPDADQLQLGAFLIAQRMKGESTPELAGFVEAARRHIIGFGDVRAPAGAVDMPCYAGKRRAAPVHLVAALRARDAGIPVLLHGLARIEGRLSAWQTVEAAGVRRATDLAEAAVILAGDGLAYIDLADACPPLFDLTGLRPRLGVRSFANTVARLLNPLGCAGQVNGVFHTPYVDLMAQANVLLEQPRSLIFMGAEGDPELYADRQKLVSAQCGRSVVAMSLPEAGCEPYPRDAKPDAAVLLVDVRRMLGGELQAREAAVLGLMMDALSFASTGELPQVWDRQDSTEIHQ